MESVRPARVVRFGAFEVDFRAGELRKSGLKIRLHRQPFQVLEVLVERPGGLVTREELKKAIWPADTFVDFDQGLNKAINRIREALGDSAESPRFVETLARRGYRFVAPVTSTIGTSAGAQQFTSRDEMHKPRRWLRWMAIASLVGLTAVVVGLNSSRVRDRVLGSSAPRIQSLAVLPFTNLSGDPAQEYFSDGLTDALITEVAQIGSIRVISRTSTMRYKKTDKPLPEILRELKVEGIVEGTVQRSGDRVRITAQFVQGSSDKHLWATSYERDVRDVLTLERDLTQEIARQIQVRLTTPNQVLIAQPRPVNPKALEAYLQGNYHLHRFSRGSGDEEKRKASEYFQQAIDADPNFAPAYVGISNAHYGSMQLSTEDIAIERKAAERAVELDPTFSDAWATLADIKFDSWDWPGAEEGYRRAIALNSNNASAHKGLCHFLDAMGHLDAGLTECQIAQQLDPIEDHLSYALYKRHEYDRAIELLLMMLRNDPNNGYFHHTLYQIYAEKGMYKEAVQHLEQVMTLFGFPELAVDLHRAFAASGYMGAMRWYAEELEHLHATNQVFLPVNLAAVYAFFGDKDRAFYWLEQAYKHQGHIGAGVSLTELKVFPPLDPLHSDPRFNDLVRRLGLPP